VPEAIAVELDSLVEKGWFSDRAEIVRLALLEFVRTHRFELQERFQREDIAWALQEKEPLS
jgi:Arc/MetJ-type ribon-helix-helix transcriptional regulator